MKPSLLFLCLASLTLGILHAAEPSKRVLFDFTDQASLQGWRIQDDVVMGGRSDGSFGLSDDGHAVFSGKVSLENNGGFSSVQTFFDPMDVSAYRKAFVRLKGDGKAYRFIVESDRRDGHYYVHEFQTGTDWQTIEVPLATMYAVRRGDRLDLPDYPGQTMAQVRFMIANGKAEDFRLEIDKIWLE